MWVPLFVETFAKTWMNGVFKPRQQPSTSTANRRSNIISTLSSNAYSLSPNSPVAVRLFVLVGIFFECVFCQLTTVLMNDFRLKTFYCKSSSKTSATTASAATAATSALSSSSSLSINKFTPSSNNNHHRTYNNSSKSNKVFLYYTPRDPRLRIFEKTKQFSNRPHQCSRNKVFSNNSNRHSSTSSYLFATATVAQPRYHSDSQSLSKITDDLCNYGELIGGHSENYKNITSGVQKQPKQNKQQPSVILSSVQNLLIHFNNCDNSIQESETSDKKCVVAAADNISFDTFVVIVRVQRHLAELLFAFSGAFIRVKITTTKQFDKMVELLEQNPNLARGHSCGLNKLNVKEEWNTIGAKLNVLGPGEGWMKVWADYKFKIKKKLIHNKAECRATGGGSFKQYILSPSEESASNLLQINTLINPGGSAFGIKVSNLVEDHTEEDFPTSENKENEEPRTQETPTKNATQGNNPILSYPSTPTRYHF